MGRVEVVVPVLTLALIGFVGGVVTGISPCILPVLPVIFFSGTQSVRRDARGETAGETGGGVAVAERPVRAAGRARPYLVIGGLVVSFTLVTLFGSLLLSVLGLPQDVLRWAGLVVLALIGVGLIVPRFEHLLERPFSWIPQRNPDASKGGFALGLALGAVYVPCAGPVLAAITVAGSTGQIGLDTVVLTGTFSVGTATPLLVFALAGRRVAERVGAFRKRQRGIRITAGIVMLLLAVGLVFDVPQLLQRALPDYTAPLQDKVNNSQPVLDLGNLTNDQNKDLSKCAVGATELQSCGKAPDIRGIQQWLNTPDGAAVNLADLRGHVVLLDFWAYSCINCQRSIPHVTAWDNAYRASGLQVIGVHSPEYAFEKEPRNVVSAAAGFGIKYPVALDNSLSTWTNYRNRYWPAHYLIDATGTVRHIKFGEGDYDVTERLIRELLHEANPGATLPAPTDTTDSTPNTGDITRETFLGSTKQVNFAEQGQYTTGKRSFTFPARQADNTFALDGAWTLDTQSITPTGGDARVRLTYKAKEVRVVLAGTGTLTVDTPAGPRTMAVSGTPRSYQVISTANSQQGTITATASSGVEMFSFTFG